MAWDQAQYEANVAAGTIPEGCYIYGGAAETVAEDMLGRHYSGATGQIYATPQDAEPLTVWLDADTANPSQASTLTADDRGVLPVVVVPGGLSPVWAHFGDGLVALKPWDTDKRLTAHIKAADPHGALAQSKAYTDSRLAAIPSANPSYGLPLDSFSGTSHTQKFAAALQYAAAQTYSPTIVLPLGKVDIDGGPYTFFDGLKLSGPLGSLEREFQTTGPQSIVHVGGPALFTMPSSGNIRNMSFQGIQFRAKNTSVDWMVRSTDLANGPIMQDADFRDLAWVGFSSVMHARHLRCSIERMYCNNGSDTQFKLGGSDNYYWTEGYSFLSGNIPANAYYVHFASMSRSRVGAIYITPQYGTAVRIDTTFGGLSFTGTMFDSTGRDLSNACQGAAVLINGGEGYVFRNCWFFNNAVNPGATGRTDKGQVYIKNPAKEILFDGCQFGGNAKQPVVTPAGTPAIYTQAGVANVRVSDPLAPFNGEKKLQQAAAGAISCNDPTWTITTAA